MADVFISYSKHDRDVAERLADDLTSAGFDVWWDFELYTGEDFHDAILTSLNACKAVVVIWSTTAVRSRWVRDEATRAAEQGKLITTHVTGFDLRDIPLGFGQLQSDRVDDRARLFRSLERRVKRQTLQVNRPSASAYFDRAESYLALGQLERSVEFLTRAIWLRGNKAEYYQQRARCRSETGEHERAIEDWTRCIKLSDFNSAEAFLGRAHAYFEKRDFEQALADCQRVQELSPYNSGALFLLGTICEFNDETGAAIANYKQVVTKEPRHFKAHRRLYECCERAGAKYTLDRTILELTEPRPQSAEEFKMRGDSYFEDCDAERALADYDAAIACDPKTPGYFRARSRVYADMGEMEEAIGDLTQVLEIEPNDVGALYSRAEAYLAGGDFEKGIGDYTVLIELTPDDAMIHHRRGWAYSVSGRSDLCELDFLNADRMKHLFKEVSATDAPISMREV